MVLFCLLYNAVLRDHLTYYLAISSISGYAFGHFLRSILRFVFLYSPVFDHSEVFLRRAIFVPVRQHSIGY